MFSFIVHSKDCESESSTSCSTVPTRSFAESFLNEIFHTPIVLDYKLSLLVNTSIYFAFRAFGRTVPRLDICPTTATSTYPTSLNPLSLTVNASVKLLLAKVRETTEAFETVMEARRARDTFVSVRKWSFDPVVTTSQTVAPNPMPLFYDSSDSDSCSYN